MSSHGEDRGADISGRRKHTGTGISGRGEHGGAGIFGCGEDGGAGISNCREHGGASISSLGVNLSFEYGGKPFATFSNIIVFSCFF